jgi:hypothetical protein
MMESRVRWQTIILLAGDWLALGLFVFLGQVDHDLVGLPRLLAQTVLLAVPWTVIALLLNAYWPTETTTLCAFLNRCLVAWLVAAPLALLLRALIQGQSTIAVPFMIITMGLGGLFLFSWRAAFYLIRARRQPTS